MSTNSKEKALFSFIDYLDLIQLHAKGFSYEFAKGIDFGGSKSSWRNI